MTHYGAMAEMSAIATDTPRAESLGADPVAIWRRQDTTTNQAQRKPGEPPANSSRLRIMHIM